MVNVGGRSKGCSQCRRRRVKCDETRPICLRCQRASLECDGPKDLTFVEVTVVPSRRKTDHARSTWPASTSSSSSTELMRPSTPLRGNLQEMFIMFTRQHLSADGPVDIALRELQASNMTSLDRVHATDPQTTHLQTVMSFSTVFFGTRHGDPDIMKQGYASHGATLQRLNRALSDPNCHLYDEVVISVTTLAMQEMLVPSGPKHYLNHMLGLEKLLALRDPSLECSEQTVHLYRCLRYLMLFASIGADKPSILAKPEWKALLRRYCTSDEEVQEQQLCDATADCSVLIAELSELLARWEVQGEKREVRIDSIRSRAQAVRAQLRRWRERWDMDPANIYAEVSMEAACINQDSPSNLSSLVFQKTTSALTLLLYDTALLYALHILITLPVEPQSQESTQDYIDMAHLAVLEICRILPGSSNSKLHADMHSSPALHWAVQVGYMVLQNDMSLEGRWLVALLNERSAMTSTKDLWKT